MHLEPLQIDSFIGGQLHCKLHVNKKFSIISYLPAKRILMNMLISINRVFIIVKL